MADGRYNKVRALFWTETEGWTDEEKLLALYLKTTAHNNALGCYALPVGYACEDLGWSPERFRELLGELLAKGFLQYDPATKMALIPGHLRDNSLENPNQVKAALKALADLPDTPLFTSIADELTGQGKDFLQPLIVALRLRAKQLGQLLPKPFAEQLPEQLAERLPKHQPRVRDPVTRARDPVTVTVAAGSTEPEPERAGAREEVDGEGSPAAGGEGSLSLGEGGESPAPEAVCIKHDGVMTPITEVPGDRLAYLVNNGKTAKARRQAAEELRRRDEEKAPRNGRAAVAPPDVLRPPRTPEEWAAHNERVRQIREANGWDKETPAEDHGYTSLGAAVAKALREGEE